MTNLGDGLTSPSDETRWPLQVASRWIPVRHFWHFDHAIRWANKYFLSCKNAKKTWKSLRYFLSSKLEGEKIKIDKVWMNVWEWQWNEVVLCSWNLTFFRAWIIHLHIIVIIFIIIIIEMPLIHFDQYFESSRNKRLACSALWSAFLFGFGSGMVYVRSTITQ